MLFSVGTRVRFKTGNETGIISKMLEDGLLMVRLDEDEIEIPAFEDDLDAILSNKPGTGKHIQVKKNSDVAPQERPGVVSQYLIVKSKGIQLAFDPIFKPDGIPLKYIVYLLNDKPYDCIFQSTLSLRSGVLTERDGKLASSSHLKLGELLFDQINDAPMIELDCWRVSTEGTGKKMSKEIRIKPQTFFSEMITAPFINHPVHLVRVFDELPALSLMDTKSEDLKTYTQHQIKKKQQDEDSKKVWNPTELKSVSAVPKNWLAEKAAFPSSVDLHIENLTSDTKKRTNADILRIQVSHFEKYLKDAIRLGVENIFVIHGVGEGKLKNAIATILLQTPEVSSFKNEFHPLYGFGATEIMLGK